MCYIPLCMRTELVMRTTYVYSFTFRASLKGMQ